MHKTIDTLMERTEESLKEYAKKQDWTPQDLECVHKAASLYDKLQTIAMNTGIWEQMNEEDDHTSRASYARGRSAVTGRYVSRGYRYDDRHLYDDMYSGDGYDHRDGASYTTRGMRGRSMHGPKGDMIHNLNDIMQRTSNEHDRMALRDVIDQLEGKE